MPIMSNRIPKKTKNRTISMPMPHETPANNDVDTTVNIEPNKKERIPTDMLHRNDFFIIDFIKTYVLPERIRYRAEWLPYE
jgi:hypothetical protein